MLRSLLAALAFVSLCVVLSAGAGSRVDAADGDEDMRCHTFVFRNGNTEFKFGMVCSYDPTAPGIANNGAPTPSPVGYPEGSLEGTVTTGMSGCSTWPVMLSDGRVWQDWASCSNTLVVGPVTWQGQSVPDNVLIQMSGASIPGAYNPTTNFPDAGLNMHAGPANAISYQSFSCNQMGANFGVTLDRDGPWDQPWPTPGTEGKCFSNWNSADHDLYLGWLQTYGQIVTSAPGALDGTGPFDACGDISIEQLVKADGTVVDAGDLDGETLVSAGDTVHLAIDHPDAAEVTQEWLPPNVIYSYRFHPAQEWAPALVVEELADWPWTGSVTRSGAAHQLDEFEVRCYFNGDNDYWTIDDGLTEDGNGSFACQQIKVEYSWRASSADPWTAYDLDPTTLVPAGGQVRLDLTNKASTPYYGFATLYLTADEDGELLMDALRVAMIGAGGEELPYSVSVDVPAEIPGDRPGIFLRSFILGCQSGEGEMYYEGPLEPGFSTEPPSGVDPSSAETAGCFKFPGMSLTKPSTWLRGLGDMFVCIVRWLFVPESSYVEAQLDRYSDALSGTFPFSAAFKLHEFYGDTVDSISTSTSCFDPGIDAGPVDVGCVEVTAVQTSGYTRNLILAVFGAVLILSCCAIGISIVMSDRGA